MAGSPRWIDKGAVALVMATGCAPATAPWAHEQLVVRVEARDAGAVGTRVSARLGPPQPQVSGCSRVAEAPPSRNFEGRLVVDLGPGGEVVGTGPELRGSAGLDGRDLRWRTFDVRRSHAWGRTERGLLHLGGSVSADLVVVDPLGRAEVLLAGGDGFDQVAVEVATAAGIVRCTGESGRVALPMWVTRTAAGPVHLVASTTRRTVAPDGRRVEARTELAVEVPVDLGEPGVWRAPASTDDELWTEAPRQAGGRSARRAQTSVRET